VFVRPSHEVALFLLLSGSGIRPSFTRTASNTFFCNLQICTISFIMECDSKRIAKVHIFKPKLAAGFGKRRFRLYHVVFIAFYIYQVIWVVSTIGQPYRHFLEKADREGFKGAYEYEYEN
jgi:hypothetical protein